MKFILAPMATLSHEAFRRSVEDFGFCDEYFTEMISAGSLIHRGPFEKFYLSTAPVPQKIVRQITGSRADYMKEAAKILCDEEILGIDINMGCSAPQIASSGAGISWMTKPITETAAMVHSVKSEIENSACDGKKAKRLSVKFKLGDENFSEKGFFEFAQMLVSEGVQMLTIHPRTKKAKYRTKPQWEFSEKLALKFPDIPVILNGDIKDKNSLEKALKTAPHVSGIMAGRAAAQKPWIFEELAGPQGVGFSVDAEETSLKFIDNVEKYQPQEFWKTRLQRFFAYYSLNFSFAHYFKTSLLNAKDINDSRVRIREYFEKCSEDKIIHVK